MKKQILKIVLALLFLGTSLKAQVVKDSLKPVHPPADSSLVAPTDTFSTGEITKDSVVKEVDNCVICKGHVHEFVYAPYNTEFKRQWPFLIATSAVYASGFILASTNKHDPLTEEEVMKLDKSQVNSFDRISTGYWSTTAGKASDYVLFVITVLPVVFLSEHHTKVDIFPLAIMAAEAYLFNYGVTTIAKNLTKRTRPYAYNPDLPIETKLGTGARESFFSGHTSQTAAATFLFANVIRDYHPNLRPGPKAAVWIFAAGVPAVEGYLRMRAGKHYPTDVIAGYLIGAASGWAIPKLHRYQKAHNKYGIGFLPYKDGMMMNMSYRF